MGAYALYRNCDGGLAFHNAPGSVAMSKSLPECLVSLSYLCDKVTRAGPVVGEYDDHTLSTPQSLITISDLQTILPLQISKSSKSRPQPTSSKARENFSHLSPN
jgi:hypothetical protein